MFLNDISQAVAIQSCSGVSDNLVEWPLLLCSSKDCPRVKVPREWSGCLVTSSQIMNVIKSSCPGIREHLQNFVLDLPRKIRVAVTPIPVTEDKQHIVFLSKDKYVTNLHVKLERFEPRFLMSNAVFCRAIKAGIDVMYIDKDASLELALWSFGFLVRPKRVVEIHGSELPGCITKLCQIALE